MRLGVLCFILVSFPQSLSPWHDAYSSWGWRRIAPDEVSCKHVEEKGRGQAMNSPTALVFGERLTALHPHQVSKLLVTQVLGL